MKVKIDCLNSKSLINDFEFIGLFLTRESQSKLLHILPDLCSFIGDDGSFYLDHCTILHKSQLNSEKVNYILNNLELFNIMDTFDITHIGWNDKAWHLK